MRFYWILQKCNYSHYNTPQESSFNLTKMSNWQQKDSLNFQNFSTISFAQCLFVVSVVRDWPRSIEPCAIMLPRPLQNVWISIVCFVLACARREEKTSENFPFSFSFFSRWVPMIFLQSTFNLSFHSILSVKSRGNSASFNPSSLSYKEITVICITRKKN